MEKFNLYFAILIALGFFALATFLLVSPSFADIGKELKIIFAVFLYLYGVFRVVRSLTKRRRRDDEDA